MENISELQTIETIENLNILESIIKNPNIKIDDLLKGKEFNGYYLDLVLSLNQFLMNKDRTIKKTNEEQKFKNFLLKKVIEVYTETNGNINIEQFIEEINRVRNNIGHGKYYINKDNFDRDNYLSGWSTKNELYEYSFGGGKKELSLKNNFFINNIIKDSIIINDNNIILHIDNIPNGLLDEIDDVTITIYTELNVISNNADTVENNSYTWKLDKNNYKTISLSMNIERPKNEQITEDNTKKDNINVKKKNTAFTLIIIIAMYIAIIIAVVNFFNKKKKLF